MCYNISHLNANERMVTSTPAPVLTSSKEVLTMADISITVPPSQSSRITERVCVQCGTSFKGRGKFCSRNCYHASMITKSVQHCAYCGKDFVAAACDIARGQRFCSRECSSLEKSKNATLEMKCAQCGTVFTSVKSRVKDGRGKFCSKVCFRAFNNKQILRHCECCGKEFKVSPTRIRGENAKYCSSECYGVAQQSRKECTCGYCGAKFEVRLSSITRGGGKYCSVDCARKSKRGEQSLLWRGGGLKRYYGPNWYEQRNLAYQRDGGVCQYCGSKSLKGQKKNAVHHIKPRRSFNGDYLAANELTNLITLCHSCHGKAEYGLIPVPKRLL